MKRRPKLRGNDCLRRLAEDYPVSEVEVEVLHFLSGDILMTEEYCRMRNAGLSMADVRRVAFENSYGIKSPLGDLTRMRWEFLKKSLVRGPEYGARPGCG